MKAILFVTLLAVSGTAFAAESGPPVLGTAVPGRGGAVFTVPPQSRTVWANIEWVTAGGQTNLAFRHLHLIGDGKERRYFFDGAAPVRWNANYPAPDIAEKWDGDIASFRVLNDKTQEEIPIRDLRIVTGNPGIPPELILSHAKAPMKLARAGRPVDIEVGVFNAGTVAAAGVAVRVEGLPAARAARDPVAKARPTAEAARKKATGLSMDGFPLLDWRGIMALLGTICRTTVMVGGVAVVADTEQTEHQSMVFRLLAADTPAWKWRRSQ